MLNWRLIRRGLSRPKQSPGRRAVRRDPPRHRARLLDAARHLFARRGFAAAGVREISTRARLNVALIHHHFGSKAGLYRALLRAEHQRLLQEQPAPELHGPPEIALRRWVRFFLRLVLLRGGTETVLGRLIAHEMHQPSRMLDLLVRDMIRPMFTPLVELVDRLTAGGLTREQVELAAHQIVAMCVHFDHSRAVITRLGTVVPDDEAGIERLAASVGDMAVGGLRELVRSASAKGGVPKP